MAYAASPTPAGVPLRRPMHPGRFLERNDLRPLALTQGQAVTLLGISRRRLNEMAGARRQLTSDTANGCALAFGRQAADALAGQAAWDSFHAWQGLRPPAGTRAASRAAITPPLPARHASAPG